MHEPINERAYGVIPVYESAEGGLLILVLQHQAGHWGFPKGHLEAGENPLQAARRELREETGIDNIDIYPEPEFRQHYSFEKEGKYYNKEVIYFLAETDNREVELDNDEIVDYAWTPLDQLEQKLIVNGQNNEAATQFLELLKGNKT